MGEAAGVKPSC
jgi:hypothetical protein